MDASVNKATRVVMTLGALVPLFLAAWLASGAITGFWKFDAFTLLLVFGVLCGAPLLLYLVGRENARLQKGVEALRESEARVRINLLEAQRIAHLGSWEFDPKTSRYSLSPEFFEILGVTESEFTPSAEAFLRFIPDQDRESMVRLARNMYLHPRPLDVDHRIIRPDGTTRWVHMRAEAQVGDDGSIVKLTGVVHDITLRKEGEEARWNSLLQTQELKRLRDLDRVRTDFINQAAHELRTPLTPLNAIVGTLERRPQENGQIKVSLPSVDVLRRNVGRLNVLVDELLDAARMQSDRLVLNRAETDLTRALRASVQSFQAAAQAQGKRLMLITPEEAVANVDESRLIQVIDNLLDNALKFTNPGGRIHVEMTPRAADLLVSVYDDGVGLTEEQRVRLFEPFSRPHEHLHRQRTGTGLGLYLSRSIVELHGGHIWCESGGPNRGSVFSFTIPRTATDGPPEVPDSSMITVGEGAATR